MHVFSVSFCPVWGMSFCFFVCVFLTCLSPNLCITSKTNPVIAEGQALGCSDLSVQCLFCEKVGKNKKCSLASVKLCNIEPQRAGFLLVQKKHGSCVLPNPVLGPRLEELVLNGCPRILCRNQLVCSGFPPSPLPLSVWFAGCSESEWRGVTVYPLSVSCCCSWSLSCKSTSAAHPLGQLGPLHSVCISLL